MTASPTARNEPGCWGMHGGRVPAAEHARDFGALQGVLAAAYPVPVGAAGTDPLARPLVIGVRILSIYRPRGSALCCVLSGRGRIASSSKRAGTLLCACLCAQNIHNRPVQFQSLDCNWTCLSTGSNMRRGPTCDLHATFSRFGADSK